MGLFETLRKISRKKKYDYFIQMMQPERQELILDIGASNGPFLEQDYPHSDRIIALDINMTDLTELHESCPHVRCVLGNGKQLPFKDEAIPIVFANAVIEHVGHYEDQKLFAEEIQRVSRKYFITTPNKNFPFEFHFKLPCYQFVPKSLQKWLNRKFGIGLWYNKGVWEDINLLNVRRLKKLFPNSKFIKVRVTISPETLICYRD